MYQPQVCLYKCFFIPPGVEFIITEFKCIYSSVKRNDELHSFLVIISHYTKLLHGKNPFTTQITILMWKSKNHIEDLMKKTIGLEHAFSEQPTENGSACESENGSRYFGAISNSVRRSALHGPVVSNTEVRHCNTHQSSQSWSLFQTVVCFANILKAKTCDTALLKLLFSWDVIDILVTVKDY